MLTLNVEKSYELQGDMTDTEFAKFLGISRTQLWRARTKQSAVGSDFLAKFKEKYPDKQLEDYFFVSDVPSKEQKRINATP